jgi:enediyne polyketide synthase
VGAEKIITGELAGRLVDAGPLRLTARERARDGDLYTYDLTLADASGSTRERWIGLTLRAVAGASPREAWPAALLAPRLEELAGEHFPGAALRAALVPGGDRAASERAAVIAAGGPRRLRHRPDGKPLLDSGDAVSTSHAETHTLAVVARVPVACDIEHVEPRSLDLWRDLLGPEPYRLARVLAETAGEPLDTSATRVWGARECLRKLGLPHETPILLRAAVDGELVRFDAGPSAIASLKVRIKAADRPLVITLLARGVDALL